MVYRDYRRLQDFQHGQNLASVASAGIRGTC